MLLKGVFGGSALNSHGNYIVDHGKSWKNHGTVFLNFSGNPVNGSQITSCWTRKCPTASFLAAGGVIKLFHKIP